MKTMHNRTLSTAVLSAWHRYTVAVRRAARNLDDAQLQAEAKAAYKAYQAAVSEMRQGQEETTE